MPDPVRAPAKPGADEAPLASAALRRRKRRDLAVILPVVGTVLLVSPFLDLFAGIGRVLGAPTALVFVFGVWFGLIAVTALLARALMDDDGAG